MDSAAKSDNGRIDEQEAESDEIEASICIATRRLGEEGHGVGADSFGT